ncbi:MAG: Na/Pi cotransporter family protein [Clostridia bacterium]|nr:Na/Pi cotransporter family protein [Clostridia bacterium]
MDTLFSATNLGATIATAVLALIAGIGIFLIACNMMSSNLESVSSRKLRRLFAKTSNNWFVGVGMGAIATAAIQSSGATSVMAIGFVNAGIMSLTQAACVIFGANIGTTITGIITALGMFESAVSTGTIFATFAGIGAFINAFAKKDTVKKVGGILAGFGMLFVGLSMMSGSMKAFAEMDAVKNFLSTISNPVLLVLIGAIITAIIQSSSVMTSVSITMVFTGLISLDQGIYLTMGSNIGSCVVAIIAGLTSTTNAKRTALIHLTFNCFGVIVFLLIGLIMDLASKGATTFGTLFEAMFPGVPQMQLAMFHTIFNVITVCMVLPMTKLFVKLVTKIIPDKKAKDDKMSKYKFKYLDENFLKTPPIAIAQLRNEVQYMAEKAIANLNTALDVVCSLDLDKAKDFAETEQHIDSLNKGITKFAVKLSKLELSERDTKYVSSVFRAVTDFERIGDYAENIIEYAERLQQSESSFSEDAKEEVRKVQEIINELYNKVMKIYANLDTTAFREAYILEENVDLMTEQMSNMHITRLADGVCTADVGAIYLALASNIERVSDHFINVADGLLPLVKSVERHTIKEIKHEVKDEFKSAEESARVFGLVDDNDTMEEEKSVNDVCSVESDVNSTETEE